MDSVRCSEVTGLGQPGQAVASAICTRCPQHRDQSGSCVQRAFFSLHKAHALMVDTSIVQRLDKCREIKNRFLGTGNQQQCTWSDISSSKTY